MGFSLRPEYSFCIRIDSQETAGQPRKHSKAAPAEGDSHTQG